MAFLLPLLPIAVTVLVASRVPALGTPTLPSGWAFLDDVSTITSLKRSKSEKNRLMDAIGLVPMQQYYSTDSHDYMLVTPDDAHDPRFALPADLVSGYDLLRIEGSCLKTRQKGTVPLHLYFIGVSRDSVLSTKKAEDELDLRFLGYMKVRTECYIWKESKGKNRLALEVFYHPEHADHVTIATPEAKNWAIAHGYHRMTKLGWITSNFGVPAQGQPTAVEAAPTVENATTCASKTKPTTVQPKPESKGLLMALDALLQKLEVIKQT